MKQIKPTKLDKSKALDAFRKYLENYKSNSGSIHFNYNLNQIMKPKSKPVVTFTLESYAKMITLVDRSKEEIAWHGIVERDGLNFKVTDILMYPQTVTSVTVTTDDVEYINFVMNLEEDLHEKLRLQGHSHVNMGVTPSSVDTAYYNELLQVLDKDDYYIFMIINKKQELNMWIYDFATNTIYERDDIQVVMECVDEWYHETIRKNIKPKKVVTTRESIYNDYPFDDYPDWRYKNEFK